jgi:hypothetical protein
MADFGRAALRAHCTERARIMRWLEQQVAAREGMLFANVVLDNFHMYADGLVSVQVYLIGDDEPRTLTYQFEELL